MTPEETKALLENIVAQLGQVASFAGAIDPALIPFIAIGRAVASQIPGLAASVQSWIEGNPPTQAELDDLRRKLAVLADPNNP